MAFVGFVLAPLMITTGKAAAAAGAQIVNPVYASGLYYPGQGVTSTLQVKNSGTTRDTFWVRYTVQDKAGGTYEVPATSVTLDPGQTSNTINRTWMVPDPADPSALTTGFYKGSFSVYDANPDTDPAAVRLDYNEKADAFQAHYFIDQFSKFNTNRWTDVWNPQYIGFLGYDAAGNPLYTTYLDPANVGVTSTGQMRLKLPAGPSSNPQAKLEGGQLRSQSLLYRYGTYEARMNLPNAPSSITGFFLYYGRDYEDEIDIEIFNNADGTTGPEADKNRKIWFTTYAPHYDANGNLVQDWTYHAEKTLPFDPTAAYHTYRFEYYPGKVSFYVDDTLLQEFPAADLPTEPLPDQPMQIIVNAWYPRWMSQTPPPSNQNLDIQWMRH
jgi:beta-glucanase (GH16 family)